MLNVYNFNKRQSYHPLPLTQKNILGLQVDSKYQQFRVTYNTVIIQLSLKWVLYIQEIQS